MNVLRDVADEVEDVVLTAIASAILAGILLWAWSRPS